MAPPHRLFFILLLALPYFVLFLGILPDIRYDAFALMRICALAGFISLSLAISMNLLKSRLYDLLGEPFIRIHHFFAIIGLILITLHPVILSLTVSKLTVFIPVLGSPGGMLAQGGRIAIILFYLAFLAALFNGRIGDRWRIIHRLMYPALLLGFIHAVMIGSDLENPVIRGEIFILCGIVIMTGIYAWNHRRQR